MSTEVHVLRWAIRIVFRKLMIFIWNRKSFPIKLYQHPQEIWGQMSDWKFFKNIFSTLSKSRKSTNLIKFCQNSQFLTFVIFVAEISNRHFCKLDKILRNFPSWHFFVFVTVFKKFGFEICDFKHRSCDILELYFRLAHWMKFWSRD